MNASKLRKQIVELNNERDTLVNFSLKPKKMIKGKLYQSARVCDTLIANVPKVKNIFRGILS